MESKKVKLRFTKSKKDGNLISFVSKHPTLGLLCAREDDRRFRKSIVLISPEIKEAIKAGVQYEAEVIPMRNGARGYICTSASPVTYEASLEMIHVKKAIYQIEIKWGNQKHFYDPFTGRKATINDYNVVAGYLADRADISNKSEFVGAFLKAARELKREMDNECDINAIMRRR